MPGMTQPGVYPPSTAVDAADVYQGVVASDGAVQNRQESDFRMPVEPCYCPMFYIGVFGGGVNLYSLGSEYDRTIFSSDGGGVGVALGQIHGCNLRSELEFAFRSNGISGVEPGYDQLGFTEVNGDVSSYSGMANAYWEFMRFPMRRIKPYIGGGIGFVSIDARLDNYGGLSLTPERTLSDSSLAYQFITGLNYKATCCLDVFVEYRYFKADSFRIDPIPYWGGGEFDYETSNLFAGVRWKF